MSPLDKLMLTRDGGAVARYHTMRIRPQSVAEHSYGVVQLIRYIRPTATHNLIVAALNHDVYEYITGDSPATAKWEHPELAAALEAVESRINYNIGLMPLLYESESTLLSWADIAELALYAVEERKQGNRYADRVIDNGVLAMRTRASMLLEGEEQDRAYTIIDYIHQEMSKWQ